MANFAAAMQPASFDQVYAYHCRLMPPSRRNTSDASAVDRFSPYKFRMLGESAADELQNLGLSYSCQCFLITVPLAEIAWRSSGTTTLRRHAILDAINRHGLESDSTAYQLLDSWLRARPDAALFQVWCDYIGALSRITSPETRNALRDWLLTAGDAIEACSATGFGLLETGQREPKTPACIQAAFD